MKCVVKNQAEKSADLYFYGEILDNDYEWKASKDDKSPTEVLEALKKCSDAEKLNIYINSCGGDVFAGNAIYNMLTRCKAYKTIYIDGLAASIASVIAFAGDKIVMPKNSYMMIHKAWTCATGDSDGLREVADRLEQIEKSIVDVYMDNVKDGVTEEEIKQKMAAETWLTAREAEELFGKVEVTEKNEVAACIPKRYKASYKNVPDDVGEEDEPEEPDGSKEPEEPDGPKEPEEPKEPEDDDKKVDIGIENLENFLFIEKENTVDNDPFYSAANIERLKKSIKSMETMGGTVHEVND